MKKWTLSSAFRWGKRLLLYVGGLFFIAMGIAFSARSGLGVAPVGSPANVLYEIGKSRGLSESVFNLGNWTFAVYCVYILAQIVLLRKRFQPRQLLQLVVSYLFGYLVNLARAMLSGLPAPTGYAMQMFYLLVSIPLVGMGVMLYLIPNLLPTPGEGTALAIADTFHTDVGAGKTIFDCTVVTAAVILSLLWFRGLVGVREGTVISALLTGFVVRLFQKLLKKPLLRFAERDGGDA